ncbi:hypothetical protein OR16_37430 [Cupriavidus basilensis OR16]|uniref:Uncharacterized protein n=1 Tax=Cupriavidus basilensis OR16 TaxID=1127483 RepID=H1SGG1_9BURK|nr:hypothetical protein OR16_37430 [Cupriavidus basilensis OR16]
MDHVAAAAARGVNYLRDIEVGARAGAGQRHRAIGLAHVEGVAIVLAVQRHAVQAHGRGGAGDADGDFAAIGDQ